MQQTEVYKLNLVEPSDTFSPDALNRNTQKLEDAMVSHEGRVDKRMDGLEDRIAVFEAKHFAYGAMQVDSEITVELGFKPIAVLVTRESHPLMAVRGGRYDRLKLVDSSFWFTSHSGGGYNPGLYSYIAFG